MLIGMNFKPIIHFIITNISPENIRFQLRMFSLGIDLEYRKSNAENMTCHQSSGGPILNKIISKIEIQQTDSIIDIGSGKGGAIITFLQYPFEKIDGIEIDKELCEISIRNISKIPHKNIKIYHCDARIFNKYNNYNFFYIFNSFPKEVMFDVLERISESLTTNPRKIVLIYNNPLFHDMVIKNKMFIKYIDPNIPSIAVKIYTNDKNFMLKANV